MPDHAEPDSVVQPPALPRYARRQPNRRWLTVCRAVDCAVSDWSSWTACSAATCGNGTRTRTRTVTTAAANGGAACPALWESEVCVVSDCPCELSDWSEWSTCPSCAPVGAEAPTQTRTRTVREAQRRVDRRLTARHR